VSPPGTGDPPGTGGVTLVLLTGGRSRRMGRDKATLPVEGRPLGLRPVEALRALVDEVVVAGPRLPGLEARAVADAVPGGGPLAGVVAGLTAARTPLAVVAACDMPSLLPALVSLLLGRLESRPELLAACCRGPRGLEPLPLALRTAASAPLGAALAAGVRALREAVDGPGLGVVEEPEWRAVDPQGSSFVNWNLPEEVTSRRSR
jgi:molybdenum cofactor guanylyltransferase